jgi:hypothetical protein
MYNWSLTAILTFTISGDKYIDCAEFLKAKLDFKKKPEC